MSESDVRRYVIIITGLLGWLGLLLFLLTVVTVIFSGFSLLGSSDPYLNCHYEPGSEPDMNFTDLREDRQRLVEEAIKTEEMIRINSSQGRYFSTVRYVQYENQTYNCASVTS